MPVLIAIAGLPGSGKTHLTRSYAREHGYEPFSDVSQRDWDAWPRVVAALRSGRNVIVDSATFTDPSAREDFEARVWQAFAAASVHWWFFEADPGACLKNILRDIVAKPDREYHRRLASFLRRMGTYHVPDGAHVVPVYRAQGEGYELEVVIP